MRVVFFLQKQYLESALMFPMCNRTRLRKRSFYLFAAILAMAGCVQHQQAIRTADARAPQAVISAEEKASLCCEKVSGTDIIRTPLGSATEYRREYEQDCTCDNGKSGTQMCQAYYKTARFEEWTISYIEYKRRIPIPDGCHSDLECPGVEIISKLSTIIEDFIEDSTSRIECGKCSCADNQ